MALAVPAVASAEYSPNPNASGSGQAHGAFGAIGAKGDRHDSHDRIDKDRVWLLDVPSEESQRSRNLLRREVRKAADHQGQHADDQQQQAADGLQSHGWSPAR